MNIGQFFIILSGVAALGSAYFFIMQGKHSLEVSPRRNMGKLFFLLSTGAALIASLLLFYAMLAHDFRYEYVAKNSSIKQPILYLISAFWAGQEGTFLLWLLLTCILGWVLYRTTKGSDGYAMAIVNVFIAFLAVIMIVKSPFKLMDSIPADGQGMNPLLQDPWMAIHPPILFVGYAAILFPFALVVSALLRNKYDLWNETGFAWTLFASVMLGAGIIIGGFWAYEVLGWGGYWGWDPVENSSLVPWLLLLALVHGMLIQKAKGALVRTNLFLAIVTFMLVLYATFLTRSGVLSDFSVHSFTDLGINNYLIGILVVTAVIGFGSFAVRFRDIRSPKLEIHGINRELMVLLSMFALIIGAAFTFVGMSSPLITGLFGKASQVEPSFYNTVNIPVAIFMSLLLGVTPFLGWTEDNRSTLLKKLSVPLILTGLSCVISYVAGVTSVLDLAFIGSATFGLVSNSIVAVRQYRTGWKTLGGPVTHIGTTLLLIGIMGSGKFDDTKQIVLRAGEPQDVFGYTMTFKDVSESPDTKTRMNLEVTDGKMSFTASPKLYWSDYNQSIMREPDIKILPLKDLYISPLELQTPNPEGEHPMLELSKGETKEFNGYTFEFVSFQTGEHGTPGSMSVGAAVKVHAGSVDTLLVPSILISEKGEQQFIPIDLPLLKPLSQGEDQPHVMLAGMSVEQKKIMLAFHGFGEHAKQANAQQLILEVSMKPLMMVVWTGAVLIIAGSVVSFLRRLRKDVHV